MTIFYFTGTGNSLAVAKKILDEDAKLVSIPQIIDSGTTHYKDDVIGVIFPVYFYTIPKMVKRFLEKTKLEAEYLFAVGTQGGMSGACLVKVQKAAKIGGNKLDYGACISIMSNFLPRFCTSTEVAKMPKKKFDENLQRIMSDIVGRKKKKIGSGVIKRCITFFASRTYKKANFKAKQKYIVNDNCNKCEICARVCPAKNIEVSGTIEFLENCEYCFACVHLCPQNALHHKKQKSSKRWINPNVSISEIVKSNNRLTVQRD